MANHAASLQQAIQQALQIGAFAIPLAWDLVRDSPQLPRGESLDPRQPRIKVIPRFDPLIDIIEPVHSPQRRVGETPLARIEAVSKVDERSGVFPLANLLVEHNLAAIGIAGPLVESQQTGEFPQVPDPPEHRPRQPVQDFSGHQGRTKLKPRTRCNRPGSEGKRDLLLLDRLFVHENNDRLRHTEPNHPRQSAGQVVIGQHPSALWVAHQLRNIFLAVIGQHDARLRAAADLRDVCDCLQRHVSASAFLWWSFLVWTPFLAVFNERRAHVPLCPRIRGGGGGDQAAWCWSEPASSSRPKTTFCRALMSAISFSGGTCSLSSSPFTVFGSSRWVTASNRSRPRVADSSI